MRSIGRLSWYRFQVWVFVRLLVCPSFVGGSHARGAKQNRNTAVSSICRPHSTVDATVDAIGITSPFHLPVLVAFWQLTCTSEFDNMKYDKILAVFDLDYTVWQPEMYQLYGKPHYVRAPEELPPFELNEAKTIKEGMILKDMGGSPMRVFHGASVALAEINKFRGEGLDIRAAVASRTDEPGWAKFCMDNLVVEDGATLSKCFGSRVEISFDNKKYHFRRLHKTTGIPFEQMLFFDNEYGNIKSVASLGVKCIYTPDGMKKEHWEEAKKAFEL